MASFTNYATLTYNGNTTVSNTVTGELTEVITASKTAAATDYSPSGSVTYTVSLINSGTADLTGLTVTDDLGGYTFDGGTVYPLSYADGSILYFIDGVLQPAPAVTAGPPMVISGISVPAGGSTMLVYETNVTSFAPLAAGGSVTNTATVSGDGISAPITASETVSVEEAPSLSILKSISPETVTENSVLTYTFEIENTGNTEAAVADNVVLSDTFNPVLSDITVTLDGSVQRVGVNYTYDEPTGVFATVAGQIIVPAATYSQGEDGSWTVTPGTVTIVVSGTV